MHREKSLDCPFCGFINTHVIMPVGDKWVAWCQRCFRVRFVEPAEAELPPKEPVD